MRKKISVILSLLLCLTLMGCGRTDALAEQGAAEASAENAALQTAALAAVTAEEGDESAEEETLLLLSDSTGSVTITEAGVYRLSGSLSRGQVVIDAPEDAKVKLILDGVSISCEGGAAIYAISADKLVIELAAGSTNAVSAAGDFVQTDDNNVDAAIFAKCDLTLKGERALSVSCETGHGIVSKDDLRVKGGSLSVQAAGQGLSGKDSVSIEDGSIDITSGTDGIHSVNDEDADKGSVELLGGSVTIRSGSDGVDTSGNISLSGGQLSIEALGKGLKADGSVYISGGVLAVDADDDAVHANDTVLVSGGELSLSSGDDGIHADSSLEIAGGAVEVLRSYEGLEANEILIAGGEIRVTASDDGINAAGGSDGSNAYGPFGGDPFANDSGSTLTISGGLLIIDAGGDGLDANGELLVTGGTVYVSGPTNSGNGALDYGSGATITGGTVIAVGASGMAENFGSASTQGSILLNLSSAQAAGSTVTVSDASGTVLASFSPTKSYQSVVVSTEGMAVGESYTVTAGTFSQTVTLSSLIYGSGMGMGGPGGMGGFGGGQGGPDAQSGFGGGPGGQGGFRP